ncbi:NADH-quinone oxidoreductase subunit C [Streptomyces sp. NBC_01445]|uniref:NADH-quinone oxidoreductase subunit C n=1 Tax=Streptomyces sp. NBC_01445 TaxID=2903869 RepID=UPI002DD86CED|nr:NADH-quinone oxidoreductase subunit C [Streptomyces sp. NBC_01445]WSE05732.1 NADH-quinone oxidoreductase subunit C [Streptomyces sp. NBC_01445]
MTGWLPRPVEELFGPDATAEESYEVLTVDVPADTWIAALETARTTLGCTYFDWLSAVDEPGTGFYVCAHVVALSPVRRLLLRTTVPHDAPVLATAVDVYAGAGWHERETHEMFGVRFEGHPHLVPLLLPDGFEGHPLRKDFVLAARVVKAWPGAKEPGEPAAGAGHGGPKRRQMLPPGVPDPNEWGPLKGQLPPAPARPARGAGRAAGDRPVRRTRTAGEGSASQAATPGTDAAAAAPPRRSRSASQGSASQTPATPETPATPGAPAAPETPAAPKPDAAGKPGATGDAPWHHARPAFDEPKPAAPEEPTPEAPAAPEEPTPEAPAAPEEPTPEAPAAPEEPTPEAPATPETAPEAPATPETPDAEETPDATPDTPETPSGGTE